MYQPTKLCKLAFKYRSDKCPQINHSYTPFYYDLLKNKRYSIKKVLEMGIGNSNDIKTPYYVTGASLLMWRDFFPNAKIYGADNDPETIFTKERVKTFLCDETNKEDVQKLIIRTGSDIDLFIDDGSHRSVHQVSLCITLMPLLKKGVIYIIEDVKFPTTLRRQLSRYGYNCYIPEFPKYEYCRKAKDDNLFVIQRRQ